MAHLMIFATLINTYYRVTLYDKILLNGNEQWNPDWLVRFWHKIWWIKSKIGKLKQIQDFFIITFIKGYWNSKHRFFFVNLSKKGNLRFIFEEKIGQMKFPFEY